MPKSGRTIRNMVKNKTVVFPTLQLGEPIRPPVQRRTRLQNDMSKQHPIHGVFGDVFESLNEGDTPNNHLKEWAEDNPTDFYRLFANMAPKPQAVKHSGEIKLSLSLQRNDALDGDFAEYDDDDDDDALALEAH
jgi:hypothetical protein